MSTFVKGLAWTVALLSGIATIFALFGGQQWLEQQGWTLAPSAAQNTGTVEPDPTGSEGTQQQTAETGGTVPEPSDPGPDLSWDGAVAWSEHTFDNLLWGIVAIGVAMLVSGAAGALILHTTAAIDAAGGFFLGLLALVCIAAVVLLGFLLHAADPGYLVWFIILTAVSAPLGFFAPVYADGY
ncbi:hypothetical protein [Glycomyces sp. NPDC021274]|uniref:hypothetical protein n=1 Tax=Glycomyces sp. NPDC021274 TaxID=3155120 RepID=UPI003407E86E